MSNLDSILKRRDITLPTKVHFIKAMVFPVVMCGCVENLTLAGDTVVPVYETLKQQRGGDEVRVCTKQREY